MPIRQSSSSRASARCSFSSVVLMTGDAPSAASAAARFRSCSPSTPFEATGRLQVSSVESRRPSIAAARPPTPSWPPPRRVRPQRRRSRPRPPKVLEALSQLPRCAVCAASTTATPDKLLQSSAPPPLRPCCERRCRDEAVASGGADAAARRRGAPRQCQPSPPAGLLAAGCCGWCCLAGWSCGSVCVPIAGGARPAGGTCESPDGPARVTLRKVHARW
mmetsp:Transcript_35938/g.106226  ORF Transcript_35938/g.106226 Transcript_35938/m.106226 type:complete len:219 (-) Transcript_35938:108-764(-)